MENWKPVPGYEDHYEISDRGRVRRKRTGRVLRAGRDGGGYLKVDLSRQNKQRTLRWPHVSRSTIDAVRSGRNWASVGN